MPARRRLLQLGLGATAVFGLAGGVAWLWQPGLRAGRLTDDGRAVFRVVARVVLEGSLPVEAAAREAALDRHLLHLEQTIAGLHRATQAELSQLLGVLSVAPGRRWFSGLATDWSAAGVAEVEAALRRMRSDGNALRQQAYHALRDLSNAAFYAQREHWAQLGYPGPVEV